MNWIWIAFSISLVLVLVLLGIDSVAMLLCTAHDVASCKW